MPFDAFLQQIEPGSNAPPVEGEIESPPQRPPSAAEEIPGDIHAAASQVSQAIPPNEELKEETQQIDAGTKIKTATGS